MVQIKQEQRITVNIMEKKLWLDVTFSVFKTRFNGT